jgi:threonine synthase
LSQSTPEQHTPINSTLTHLECARTGKHYDAGELHNLSEVGAPLLARYDLDKAAATLTREGLQSRGPDMWRYLEVMPAHDLSQTVSLGEGGTPLRPAPLLGQALGFSHLLVKDESLNPTGSFKARGLSAAVTAAKARGATRLAIPTAGNAGGALAAYAAAAGLESFVFMPRDTPAAFQIECRSCGAHVQLVDGLISDCGKIVAARKEEEGWFDVSTLKEPYRVEGKKTMGYELAEQLGWELPEVVIYPTGGGTGLIGMWKAFDEMEAMGLIGAKRPRMVSVQAAGCAPIVRAFEAGEDSATMWEGAQTVASGLRVPGAVGDFLMLQALRQSDGTAVAVSDAELVEESHRLARYTGIFPAPEGGATLAALLKLKESGWVGADERVVLFNTGSGYKYLEALGG